MTNSSAIDVTVTSKVYNLAVVPKETNNNPFYDQVHLGCMEQAATFGDHVNCIYAGPDTVNATEQASIVRELLANGTIDGISMAVIDVDIATELAQEAFDKNIPLITFDSDAPLSKRLMYVGTDNVAFGESLGKVLLQLKPQGGRYGIITAAPPNIAQRVEGLRKRLTNSKWVEVEDSPKDCLDSIPLSQSQMYDYARDRAVDAILPMGGWPMRDEKSWKKYVDTYRNVTHVVADADPEQLALLAKVYVDGLVGQVPYQMGSLSVTKLLELSQGKPVTKEILATSLLEVVQIPLLLPAVALNHNYIGNLIILGFVLFGIVALLSIGFTTWTILNRKRKVIKASQPFFLVMISMGVLLLGSALIPLSFDDSGNRPIDENGTIACMSVPWLLCLGFCVTFSALFSKTWRVNRIFKSKERFVKVRVTEKDVLVPFFIILFLNVLVLSLWTTLAPLQYVRRPLPGTDDWNRIISDYGMCASVSDRRGGEMPYLIVLGAINLSVVIMANFQAYHARSIQSEFSESKYIAMVMMSFLQSICIGVPILFLVQDNPPAYYLVMVFIVFLTSMAILLLIFIPKVMFARMYSGERREEFEIKKSKQELGALPSQAFFEKSASRIPGTCSNELKGSYNPTSSVSEIGSGESASSSKPVNRFPLSSHNERLDESSDKVRNCEAIAEEKSNELGESDDDCEFGEYDLNKDPKKVCVERSDS